MTSSVVEKNKINERRFGASIQPFKSDKMKSEYIR